MSTTHVVTPETPHPHPAGPSGPRSRAISSATLWQAIPEAFKRLNPRYLVKNPVMFTVEIGSFISLVLCFLKPSGFTVGVTIWLWLTVLFGTFADAIAEGRGRAQAASLRAGRKETQARKLLADGTEVSVSANDLTIGDTVVVEPGQTIPGDGDVIEGVASVDESTITGESAPVIREAGGDRSAVTGGTMVLSDKILVRITTRPGESFVDRMISLVEGANRQRTPNESALNLLLVSLTIVFTLVVMSVQPLAIYSGGALPIVTLVALFVCLIPTTIGALLAAIGIAGMDRLVRHNVLAMSGRAVEAAGDVSTLLLDKTGTITYGNRRAVALHPVAGTDAAALVRASWLSSLADETPEGRSTVDLAAQLAGGQAPQAEGAEFVPFSAMTRMSGLDLPDGTLVRKGASSSVLEWARENGAFETGQDDAAEEARAIVARISQGGGTPLIVVEKPGAATARILGVIELADIVKPGMKERFAQLRAMGIKTVMITGDNPATAAAIAKEAGVDDFLAEATPEDKLALIKQEQEGGRLVAMTGDGTNDAPALAQADVGVAMNTGTSAAKEAGNMVDLDSDPTKLIDIVQIGKQLLITRGSLTTFSIANDVAKYFAIIPAAFAAVYPQLNKLNIMGLSSPTSAILSAVIFNALIIVILIPLSLRGVKYTPGKSASQLLSKNLLIYGVGGLIAPFIGIKIIDVILTLFGIS